MVSLIKILAFLFVIIDHIGAFFFPEYKILRIIGRLAMPLFAYSVSEGLIYTKNTNKYCQRILLFALIAQVPYIFLIGFKLNIMFSFALAITIVILNNKYKTKLFYILIIISILFSFEYSFCAVTLVIIFYEFRYKREWMIVLIAATIYIYTLQIRVSYQVISILSVLLLYLSNKQIRVPGRLFYYLYPGHLFLILFLKVI